MKDFKKGIYCFYLGASLSLFGDVHLYNWEFYAIAIPTIILQTILNEK